MVVIEVAESIIVRSDGGLVIFFTSVKLVFYFFLIIFC